MEYRHGSHTVYDVKYHIVWVAKYRYQVLQGEVGQRTQELVRQISMSYDFKIEKGVLEEIMSMCWCHVLRR